MRSVPNHKAGEVKMKNTHAEKMLKLTLTQDVLIIHHYGTKCDIKHKTYDTLRRCEVKYMGQYRALEADY